MQIIDLGSQTTKNQRGETHTGRYANSNEPEDTTPSVQDVPSLHILSSGASDVRQKWWKACARALSASLPPSGRAD